jgi:hypothetical protein
MELLRTLLVNHTHHPLVLFGMLPTASLRALKEIVVLGTAPKTTSTSFPSHTATPSPYCHSSGLCQCAEVVVHLNSVPNLSKYVDSE